MGVEMREGAGRVLGAEGARHRAAPRAEASARGGAPAAAAGGGGRGPRRAPSGPGERARTWCRRARSLLSDICAARATMSPASWPRTTAARSSSTDAPPLDATSTAAAGDGVNTHTLRRGRRDKPRAGAAGGGASGGGARGTGSGPGPRPRAAGAPLLRSGRTGQNPSGAPPRPPPPKRGAPEQNRRARAPDARLTRPSAPSCWRPPGPPPLAGPAGGCRGPAPAAAGSRAPGGELVEGCVPACVGVHWDVDAVRRARSARAACRVGTGANPRSGGRAVGGHSRARAARARQPLHALPGPPAGPPAGLPAAPPPRGAGAAGACPPAAAFVGCRPGARARARTSARSSIWSVMDGRGDPAPRAAPASSSSPAHASSPPSEPHSEGSSAAPTAPARLATLLAVRERPEPVAPRGSRGKLGSRSISCLDTHPPMR